MHIKLAFILLFNLSISAMVHAQTIVPGIFYAQFNSPEDEDKRSDHHEYMLINFKEDMTFRLLKRSKEWAELGRGTFNLMKDVLTLNYENVPDNNLFNRREIQNDTETPTVSVTVIDKITKEHVKDAVILIHKSPEQKYYADSSGVVSIPRQRLILHDLLILKRDGFLFQEILFDGFQSISWYSTHDSYYQSIDATQYSVITTTPSGLKLGFNMSMGLLDNQATFIELEFIKITPDHAREILKGRKDYTLFFLE